MKKVIYTAIIGKYDRLREIPERFRRGWELRCFTDQALQANGWEVIEVDREEMPAVALARRIKILSHYYLEDAELSFWIDGSLKIVGDLNVLAGRFDKKDFALFEHPRRNCIYQEFQACCVKKKADLKFLEEQEKAYREIKIPAGGGLAMTGLLLRRKSDQTRRINECWWKHTSNFKTWRDQLTLPLALHWPAYLPEVIPIKYAGKYFKVAEHLRKCKLNM